ncbi:MAG: hypothetical protein IKH57_09975 [Clostridia bacterium]|nr:hypothetical protein [Clostridia bacterium]
MKKVFILLALVLCLLPLTAFAKDLDEIQNYGVSVQLREDGTADLTYHVDWLVLDDKAEGPLEWVKIGIPNQHADSFTAISSNIRKIGYLSDGGSFVKITFDRKYYAGETVSFDFSLHQSYLYVLENGTVRFSLSPGWFDKIEVKNAVVRWNAAGVQSSNADKTEDGYLFWKTVLRKGERLRTEVVYPRSYFMRLDENQQSTRAKNDDEDGMMLVLGALVLIGIICLIVWASRNDNYRGGSGFGGGHPVIIHTHSHARSGGCVRSSCACASCACACACACAGGGRAGCAKKDFYKGPGDQAPSHTDDVFPKLFQALENAKQK